MPKQETLPSILILIAAQCDEEFVVRCLCQMRQKGIAVSLVGLYAGFITGAHGVWLRPDQSLPDLDLILNDSGPRLLILPGPQECTMKLLFNPRVHGLIEATLRGGGCVATVSSKTRDLLARSGLAATRESGESEDGFLFQGHLTAGEFIEQLTARVDFLSEGA